MRFIYVPPTHALSRFNVFPGSPLRVHHQPVSSIEAGFWFIAMKLDHRTDLANDFLANERLHRRPSEIKHWALQCGYEPSANVVMNAPTVYSDLVIDQLRRQGNPLKFQFDDLIRRYGTTFSVKFLVCGPDRVWATGCREPAVTENPHGDFPGFNLYGELLCSIFKQYRSGPVDPVFGIRGIMRGDVTLDADNTSKTVLFLSDSIGRQIKTVDSGHFRVISGGTFGRLSDVIVAEGVAHRDFSLMIIHCGINDSQRGVPTRERSWLAMEQCLTKWISEGFQACNIIISLPIPHPSCSDVRSYSSWVETRAVRMGMNIVNWSRLPSSPFGEHGLSDLRLYDKDRFHLSHAGFSKLWHQWCDLMPSLSTVGYQMGRPRFLNKGRPAKRDHAGRFIDG